MKISSESFAVPHNMLIKDTANRGVTHEISLKDIFLDLYMGRAMLYNFIIIMFDFMDQYH